MAEVAERPSLILSFEELVHLTGYRQPAAQLNNLKAQGFHRARRNVLGSVVLERAHYEAVCSDRFGPQGPEDVPLLRSQRLARRT